MLDPLVLYICTFSDAKKHKACHLWAGLYPFIKELMQEGYLEFVFISDSPTKQYRNRFVAALLEELFSQADDNRSAERSWTAQELKARYHEAQGTEGQVP